MASEDRIDLSGQVEQRDYILFDMWGTIRTGLSPTKVTSIGSQPGYIDVTLDADICDCIATPTSGPNPAVILTGANRQDQTVLRITNDPQVEVVNADTDRPKPLQSSTVNIP